MCDFKGLTQTNRIIVINIMNFLLKNRYYEFGHIYCCSPYGLWKLENQINEFSYRIFKVDFLNYDFFSFQTHARANEFCFLLNKKGNNIAYIINFLNTMAFEKNNSWTWMLYILGISVNYKSLVNLFPQIIKSSHKELFK